MKIFTWIQNKVNGRHGNEKPNSINSANHQLLKDPQKEEFIDWPHLLLAIGTFGNNDLKEDTERNNLQENLSSSQDLPQDVTNEEVKRLQNEINLLLHKQVGSSSPSELEADGESSLEAEKINSDGLDSEHDHLRHSTCVVLNRGKDICLDNTNTAIGKKSLSFLLKKMFVCRSGFTPVPSIRDQIPESRMEKIFRGILHKKIYPQSSNPRMSTKKYLSNGYVAKSANEDEGNEKADNGSKWVKTDSEYIVLEI